MNLGINSLSLAVKDIKASKSFYENLGFKNIPDGGSVEEKWLIMENGDTKIGLFQDMFPNNIITFNPKDARAIHKAVNSADVPVISA
ncbi:MAG: VOC family protein, partial [Acidobacteria bacterium]|nr:VOC family protein [Acidobacteriota bacterium]